MKLNCSIIENIIHKVENPELISISEFNAITLIRPTVEIETVGHMVFVNCFNSEYQIIIEDTPIGLIDIEKLYIISNSSEIAPRNKFSSIEKCVRYIILYHFYINQELNKMLKCCTNKNENIYDQHSLYKTNNIVKIRDDKPKDVIKKEIAKKLQRKIDEKQRKLQFEEFFKQEILPLSDPYGSTTFKQDNDEILLKTFIKKREIDLSNKFVRSIFVCIARIKLKMHFVKIQEIVKATKPKKGFCEILQLSHKNNSIISSYLRMLAPLPEPLNLTINEIKKVANYLKENDNANWKKYSKYHM